MSYGQRGRGGYGNRGGSYGSSFGSSFKKPVEVGKEYTVTISDTSRRGEGIARIEGFVIFVPNTKPNDHVKVKITRVANRFAQGEVVQ
jgi:predicted RNA-binding protein with TRAM domain